MPLRNYTLTHSLADGGCSDAVGLDQSSILLEEVVEESNDPLVTLSVAGRIAREVDRFQDLDGSNGDVDKFA